MLINPAALLLPILCWPLAAAGEWTVMDSRTTVWLRRVWGTSETDVFAVGDGGTILHYDGNSWTAMNSGTTKNLGGVFGFAPNNVYAVGQNMTILHYDGTGWSPMNATNPPSWLPSLNGVWGAAPNDIWAVGSGWIRVHYNGSTWSGTTNVVTDWLWSAWGSSASNVVAVGDHGSVYRWDGSRWSQLSVNQTNSLWADLRGIWGAGPNEIYVAGDYDQNGSNDGDNSGAVWKYDGSQWTFLWRDAVPDLLSIWASSATDVYVSGRKGAIARFDGKEFTRMKSNTAQDLWSIWGSGKAVFAVGVNGTIVQYITGGSPAPAIRGSVMNGASFLPTLAPGSFLSIFGQNLAPATRSWDGAISGAELPTQLEGVSVSVGGRPAALAYISPAQLNALLPAEDFAGTVEVRVTTPQGSAIATSSVQPYAPAFFLRDPENRKYVAATRGDGTVVGKTDLIPGMVCRPAAPGEEIVLWGSGFGPTDPATPSLRVIQAPYPVMVDRSQLRVTIGGRDANVTFAGVTIAGVWQINVRVPEALGAGDHAVTASIGGQSTQEGAFITTQ